MAGPDLTPYSFERGLQEARFPNPYSPEMEGVVGFGGGSFAMTTDAAVMFWSNTALPPYADEGAGAWCYVDGGRRFTSADWSAPMQFFGTCNSYPPGS